MRAERERDILSLQLSVPAPAPAPPAQVLPSRNSSNFPWESISRDSLHKRRATGGEQKAWRKKRKFELGRPSANTKLTSADQVCVRPVRCRGGNMKFRALRLDCGNFAWGSEAVTRKVRILDVVYNASNNELWYLQHYGVGIGKKKSAKTVELPVSFVFSTEDNTSQEAPEDDSVKQSGHLQRKLEKRQADRKLDIHIDEQFATGRLYACISSRPGQCGRISGYVLEGKELEFYTNPQNWWRDDR
ncbi:40S ribosomal protein [Cymbomonas tetramitiformis]|uniref:40S ribosomal protein S8 n=1 Tax=Cymbomonas tetramitiformis TaxID=36881 RepID=A0AAE0BDZ7_9CHLO|nr:40S ribosomal protein [Cymbomonas tetramitiformis]